MSEVVTGSVPEDESSAQTKLSFLLAMAMFVLVVDTSLMNVSISAVVEDLDTTVSNVQAAIALEALVSAAFILIGGKTGDLIGRKLAYVLGLLGYAAGAIAMTRRSEAPVSQVVQPRFDAPVTTKRDGTGFDSSLAQACTASIARTALLTIGKRRGQFGSLVSR